MFINKKKSLPTFVITDNTMIVEIFFSSDVYAEVIDHCDDSAAVGWGTRGR